MKFYSWKICFVVFIAAVLLPVQLYAACQIVGTTVDGYIVVCDGPDTIGINSGNGSDIVTINTGAEVSKAELQSTSSTTGATATTFSTQGGDDQITNTGSVRANASVTINAQDFVATHLGDDETNASVSGDAVATGINAGTSILRDTVTNNGAIDVTATSNVKGGRIQLDLFDVTKADATLTANATATGIKGTDNNEIVNNGTVTVASSASVTAWTGEVNVLDQATANTSITPSATSTGILGGTGYDQITNAGVITATATTNATVPIVELNVVDLAVGGAGIGTEENPMVARAIGIDAGNGGGEMINTATGKISAQANSGANIENIVLTLYDFTITSDMRKDAGSIATHVEATATGIAGGDGDDRITNHGEITAKATSHVVSVGLGVGAEGVPSGVFSPSSDFYKPLFTPADAIITAAANAIGIQGGAGNDTIINTGKITAYAGPIDAEPSVISVGASVSFPLLELTGLSEWLGNWNNLVDYPPAIAVAGAGTSAQTTAVGIDAGAGNDTVNNNSGAEIKVTAKSLATTDQASVTLQNVKSQGGTGWSMNIDLALAKANTIAVADATGLDGAAGNDVIENNGMLDVDADATAVGTTVSVVAELLKGMDQKKGLELLGLAAALTNVVTEARSTATGIFGGTGNDYIYNFGQMEVDANALVNTFSANVSVQGEIKGLGGGVTFADTSTTSTASTTGISGGDGSDKIISGMGGLHAYATSEAYSESFSVVVQAESKGVEIGGALALGTTTAIATATGMDGGTGDDTFLNQGFMDVKAEATANTLAAVVDVQAGVKGLGAGVALIDTTTTTTANAIGISGGEGKDNVTNETSGTVKVRADSNTYAEQFAVTVQGESTGLELGGALTLGSTKATATAMGIGTGKEGDEIYNYEMVDVRADATTNNLAVTVDVQGSVNGLALGVAFTDVSSTAATTATGISGGEGDDTIQNSTTGTVKAYAESDSYTEVVSVNVQGKGTGIVIGGALALAGSSATATATGMAGGAGKDTLTNEGFTDANATSTGNSLAAIVTVQGAVEGFGGQAALTDTSTSSTAITTGISGGEDTDTITNSAGATVKSYATAEAYAESVSLSVQGYGTGVTMAGSLARGVTTPTASATGISGGEGDDTLINQGLTDVKAITDSTSVAVSVRAVGVIEGISIGASLTDTSTTANATAIGVDGGLGNDVVYNSGTIQANTDSTLRAASVSFDFGGVPIGISVGAALASASTNTTGTATGINGDEGDDNITNAAGSLIDVDSTAHATSTAVSISANVIGAAWTNTSATTVTQATGIAGGGGKDWIGNLGTIDVDSSSTANVANVSVNLIGATPVTGGTSSTANAAGIDAGLGDDWIRNEGTVTVDSISTTDATGVAVQVAGYSDMDVATHAIANATGISGGDGVNTIYNTSTGSIRATATTFGDTTAVNINLLGYSKTDGSSTGNATAIGIVGGKGVDTIQNDGTIVLDATSDTDASSTAVQLMGYGESRAKSVSNATVRGIDGGDGINALLNMGSITGTATANANASSYDIQLSGGGKATAGTEATATAIGISGGKDMDTIRNQGTINLTAQSTLVSESRSFKIFGVGIADADSKALAFATGIDGAEGPNTLTNTGSITVSSNAGATTTGMTANIGVAAASASTTSNAHSMGITSGSGEDTITNEGILNVKATSNAYAGSGDLSFVGLSLGDGLTGAIADGIVAGDGKDVVINKGIITVGSVLDNDHPMAYSNVESVSLSLSNFSIGALGSKAQANGIMGGRGNDTITNTGAITVGDDHWMAKGRAFGFSGQFIEFFSFTDVGATAETVSTGIDGGDGNDGILNDSSGVLTVKASSYAWTKSAATVSTFGSPATFAGSTTKATATGISGGSGDDVIENRGTIDVYAHSWADAYTDSWVGWGSPYADSTANATAAAIGIDAGGGQNRVTNSGVINVNGLAETTPYAKADSDVDRTESESTSNSQSTALGIRVGDGNNTVTNTANGAITVTAIARTFDALGNVATSVSDEEATVTAVPASIAIGIQAGKGNNFIFNDGQMTVTSEVHAKSHATASSTLYTATATAKSGGSADATGIKVGDGGNTIINNGTLKVTSTNEGIALSDYPTAHLDNGYAYAGGGNTSLASNATGISAGNGVNLIENHNSMIVSSTVNADARAYTNTATTTTHAEAYAGGNAKATGILVGNGQNTIKTYGNMSVSATANAYALGSAEEYGSAYIGSGSSPGIVAEAVGISTGHGINTITNYGQLEVFAIAAANSEAAGDESTQTVANSNANAAGIRTGDGANTVTNLGTINIAAHGLDTNAVGIQTGAGNDTIINSGNITAANKILFFTRPGIAITSGAGDDRVFLMDGSETNGHIDLGDGDDWLTFAGAPTVNGNVTGADGTDTLVFQGTGSIGFAPTAFEHAIKQGAGTFIVANLPTMARIEIKQGTLQVNSDYQFSNHGSLQTFVKGDGSFGQFKVNGNAQLAGNLEVLKQKGLYKNGTTYNIIEATGAQGVTGAFADILLPETKPLLGFDIHQLPNAVEVEVHARSFAAVATNRVERAIANYLDRIMPAAGGDLSNVLGEFQSLSTPQFAMAFSSLSPDSYDNYTRATYDSTWQYTRSLQRRLANVRTYGSAAGYDPESKPLLLAFAGSDASLGELLATGRISQTQAKNGLWFNGYGQWGDQEPDKGFTGFDYNIYGGTLGFDHAFTDKMTAGLSLGYSRTDVDLDHHQGDGTIKTFAGSLYGSYFTKNAYVEGAASYGRNWYDNSRLVTIGSLQRKASSDHEGDLFSAYLGGGYAFDVKNWAIGPFASLRYIYLSEDSFREKGADSLNLSVDHRNTDSLTSELGLRLARVFNVKYGSLVPEVSAAWSYDFDIDDRVITASFEGSPGTAFSIDGQPVERNGAVLGVGLTFLHKSGFSTSLRYRGEFREKYQSHGVMGEFRLMF